jgi:hypothetical protein
MPHIKNNAIPCDASGTLWDAILQTPGETLLPFTAGAKVRTLSGGRVLQVVKQSGLDVVCNLGDRQVTLPRAILTSDCASRSAPRRGRPVNRALAPASGTTCVIPGTLFDAADVAHMRHEYQAASRRLGLEGNPQLAREVAIAILRSAAARH